MFIFTITFMFFTCVASSQRKVAYNFGPLGHLKASKLFWKEIVRPGSIVVDATCGNGNDSLFLSELCFGLGETIDSESRLHCIDIQRSAIENTKMLLSSKYPLQVERKQIQFFCQSHDSFPADIKQNSVSLCCYNLGYLPGGKKDLTTQKESTISSLYSATQLLKPGGLLTITSYTQHPGGQEEDNAVREFLSSLDPNDWRVYSHHCINKPTLPILYNAFKIDKGT